MQLNFLDIQHFYHLPCHVYWKDKKGVYLGSNDYPAMVAGVKSKGSDFIGLTDLDICIKPHATIFRMNDKTVLEELKPLILLEEVKFLQGVEYTVLSHKYPVFNQQGKPAGVLGLSFILSKENALPNFNSEVPLLNFHHTSKHNLDHLTPRQLDCLYLLVMGKTAKQISQTLKLSVRTVEHHLTAIKKKYACPSRSDLITKALKMPCIKNKLFALS